MNPKNQPLHRFMLTLTATFKSPNGIGAMKIVNTTISRSHKSLPLVYIKQAQEGVAMQLQMFGVKPEDIMDVSFNSASYLGLMTEKEFTVGLSEDESASASLSETEAQPSRFDKFN